MKKLTTLIASLLLFSVSIAQSISSQDRSPNIDKHWKSNVSVSEAIWDVQLNFDVTAVSGASGNAGSEFDGTFIYSTRWATNLIHRYTTAGALVEEFSIPGVTNLRDLAYDGNLMYGGTGATTIYEMNFITKTLISTITSPVVVRHIAYDAVNDGFWVGNWDTDIVLLSRSGTVLATIPAATHGFTTMYGSAWDNYSPGGPFLWIFNQGAGAGSPQIIHQLQLPSGTPTGVTHDVISDIGAGNTSGIAGGLWIASDFVTGFTSLGGLLQGTPDEIFVYELGTAGAAPIPPVLVSPVNGATGVVVNPTLKWNASTGATSYRLQVSTASNFSSFVYNQDVGNVTQRQVLALNNLTPYYWRVSATNTSGTSGWSTVWTFTTAGAAPNVPVLGGPANGLTGVALNPTFNWSASTGAASYRLQVSTASNFSSFIYNQDVGNTTSKQVTGLQPLTVHYWRVNATNGSGTSGWSTVWNFTTSQPVPTIVTSVNELIFEDVKTGENSASQDYTLSGSYLTADININAPDGFQVSTDNTNWSSSVIITQSGGTVTDVIVYARFSPTSIKAYEDSITHTSADIIIKEISVTGTGLLNYPSSFTINHNYTFGAVTSTNSYQIIGLPGANNIAISSVIIGSAGKDKDWRAFSDSGSGPYVEYDGSANFNFKAGNAFWVLSKNAININQSVNAVPLLEGNLVKIPLNAEYNLISNPFDKIIAWTAIHAANPGITQSIKFFNSGSYISSPPNFEPYKGYYFVNSTALDSLIIPFAPISIGKQEILASKNLEILLLKSGVEKTGISIGISEDAKPGMDKLDIYSPPLDFCDVFIAINNPDLESNIKILEKEFRPEISEGQEYNLIVKNISDETIILFAKGLEYFGKYEIYVLDNMLNKMYDLKKQNTLEVKRNTDRKEYTLLIGTGEYINNRKISLLPKEYKLYQNYPNPFNPSTTITFAVPQQSIISLKIYNSLGEQVADLINNQMYDAGYHEVNFNGSTVTSGVYFYKLQADGYVNTGKMLLLK